MWILIWIRIWLQKHKQQIKNYWELDWNVYLKTAVCCVKQSARLSDMYIFFQIFNAQIIDNGPTRRMRNMSYASNMHQLRARGALINIHRHSAHTHTHMDALIIYAKLSLLHTHTATHTDTVGTLRIRHERNTENILKFSSRNKLVHNQRKNKKNQTKIKEK